MPDMPGAAAALIEHAAAIIVAKQKEPYTAPGHWAGALWEAGMLVAPGFNPDEIDQLRERAERAEAALHNADRDLDVLARGTEVLQATIARVRELHHESEHVPGHCAYEGFTWPCKEARILDGEVPAPPADPLDDYLCEDCGSYWCGRSDDYVCTAPTGDDDA